jgi:hypothetical protein
VDYLRSREKSAFAGVFSMLKGVKIVSYLKATGEKNVRAPKKAASVARKRPDERSQLLIYMKPGLIRQLKLAALAKGTPAFVLAEEAVEEWLKKHKREIRLATAKISRGGSKS